MQDISHPSRIRLVVVSVLWSASVALYAATCPAAELTWTIKDKASGQPVACRIHLVDPAGKPQRAGSLPFWKDHFVCGGEVKLDLAPGTYSYTIERGPEYSQAKGTLVVKADGPSSQSDEIERLADMAAAGWWSGEMHVHRAPADIELLMRAEDLHVAQVITWWQNRRGVRSVWNAGRAPPSDPLVRFDGDRYYQLMAGEDERNGGALLFCNLRAPLAVGEASAEYPSPMKFVTEARSKPKAWIDVEKPFWWDVPVWVASGKIDSIGIANNHMCRSEVKDQEAWGKPRDTRRLPPPTGNGLWTQEIYYHLLNCGLRIPPSAGSASGVLPNPVGYNRVYVHVDGPLTYDKWWDGLRAGQVFVTNGPLLRVQASGFLPGHVFSAGAGETIDVELRGELTSRDPIRAVEIITNGKVDRTIAKDKWDKGELGKLEFDRSGWFLVRAIADVPETFRFASTGPFYVEIGPEKQRVSKASARFFVDWIEERLSRIELDDPLEREEVVVPHHQARRFWREKVKRANAE